MPAPAEDWTEPDVRDIVIEHQARCPVCGRWFVPTPSARRHCRPSCARAARRPRR